MPLYLSKVIASKFTNVEDSNFKLVRNGREYHVHSLVLREYSYFQNLLRGTWKESETGRYLSYDDPMMFEAVVHHIYGALLEDVIKCCCPMGAESALFKDLISANPSLGSAEGDALGAIEKMSGGKHIRIRRDPVPAFAQLVSVYCMQISQLYIVADKYGLDNLKGQLPPYIKTAISAAWNHSAILDTFRLLLNSTQAEDVLHVWVMEQIKVRFFLLLKEPQFTAFCIDVPQLQMAKKLATGGHMQAKSNKSTRYCYFGNSKLGKFCHRNVSTKSARRVLVCTECGYPNCLGPARTRMWPEEGDVEPEPEPEVKPSPRKRARTTI